jgi:hypothetical protein
MRPPALAVLLDRTAPDTFGGRRSGEQGRNGGGGNGEGELTHGVLLGVSLTFPGRIFHIIRLHEIYIQSHAINARTLRKRSIIINVTSHNVEKLCVIRYLSRHH